MSPVPVWRPLLPLLQQLLFKSFKDHTCLVRGNDDVFRMRKGSCFCCQLGHNAAFHTPTPPYAFGPNKGNPPKCKLASTDLFLSTAVALWHHKHDVFHSLVRNHWGYRMKWSAVYGNDTTKHFGRDELPLLSFYEWLHEYWFDGNTGGHQGHSNSRTRWGRQASRAPPTSRIAVRSNTSSTQTSPWSKSPGLDMQTSEPEPDSRGITRTMEIEDCLTKGICPRQPALYFLLLPMWRAIQAIYHQTFNNASIRVITTH